MIQPDRTIGAARGSQSSKRGSEQSLAGIACLSRENSARPPFIITGDAFTIIEIIP